MGSAAAVMIWLVILAALIWFLAGGGLTALSANRRNQQTENEDATTLEYAVPEGQDPAAIMAVLAPAGYVARLVEPGVTRILVIASDDGAAPDRSAVRALIARANTTIQDPAITTTDVRFVDETA